MWGFLSAFTDWSLTIAILLFDLEFSSSFETAPAPPAAAANVRRNFLRDICGPIRTK
jgi:hypothetical protein